jgi:Tfp pilus assembly major pilin PilA
MVEMLLKWQYVSAAGCALRASLGTRFTRTQVTPRSSALNAYVENAKCTNWHTHCAQSSQPAADVKASNQSETAVKTAKRNCVKNQQIEVEETLPRSNRDPHSQRLTGVPPEGATSQIMVALAVRSPEGAPLRSLGHWHVALGNVTTRI